MDIEQLKMILETIQQMGGDAKEFGIIWLICTSTVSILPKTLYFCWGTLLVMLGYKATAHIARASIVGYSIAEMIGCPVYCTWRGEDTEKVCERIDELLEKEKVVDAKS